MSQPTNQICQQQNKHTEGGGPKVKGFRFHTNFLTSHFRQDMVDEPKYDHTEKAINSLVEMKFVDD